MQRISRVQIHEEPLARVNPKLAGERRQTKEGSPCAFGLSQATPLCGEATTTSSKENCIVRAGSGRHVQKLYQWTSDRHAICKQVAALCFPVFPSVADAFMREVEESEKRRISANKSTTRDRTLRQKLEKRRTLQIALRRPR